MVYGSGGKEGAGQGEPLANARLTYLAIRFLKRRSMRRVLTTDIRRASMYAQRVYIGECEMRDAAINLRALPQQRTLIDQAAELLGENRSNFMLEAACAKAQAVLLDQVFFSLDDAKFQEFTAMLDAPALSNPGLARLLAITAPWNAGA